MLVVCRIITPRAVAECLAKLGSGMSMCTNDMSHHTCLAVSAKSAPSSARLNTTTQAQTLDACTSTVDDSQERVLHALDQLRTWLAGSMDVKAALHACEQQLDGDSDIIVAVRNTLEAVRNSVSESPGAAHLLRRIDELEQQVHRLSQYAHVPGAYSTTAPAFPGDLDALHGQTFGACKLLGQTVWKALKDKALQAALISRLKRHVASQCLFDNHSFEPLPLKRALLVASLTAELFRHFESATFGVAATCVPGPDRSSRRKEAGAAYRAIIAADIADLLADTRFSTWHAGVVARLQHAWCGDGLEWAVFDVPQLLECAKLTWALHHLVRAFPWPPELVHVATGAALDPKLYSTHYNVDDDGVYAQAHAAHVAIVVFPAFLLDESYQHGDAYCYAD